MKSSQSAILRLPEDRIYAGLRAGVEENRATLASFMGPFEGGGSSTAEFDTRFVRAIVRLARDQRESSTDEVAPPSALIRVWAAIILVAPVLLQRKAIDSELAQLLVAETLSTVSHLQVRPHPQYRELAVSVALALTDMAEACKFDSPEADLLFNFLYAHFNALTVFDDIPEIDTDLAELSFLLIAAEKLGDARLVEPLCKLADLVGGQFEQPCFFSERDQFDEPANLSDERIEQLVQLYHRLLETISKIQDSLMLLPAWQRMAEEEGSEGRPWAIFGLARADALELDPYLESFFAAIATKSMRAVYAMVEILGINSAIPILAEALAAHPYPNEVFDSIDAELEGDWASGLAILNFARLRVKVLGRE